MEEETKTEKTVASPSTETTNQTDKKTEIIDKITEETSKATEELLSKADSLPFYKKIGVYIIVAILTAIGYVAVNYGDRILSKLDAFIESIL